MYMLFSNKRRENHEEKMGMFGINQNQVGKDQTRHNMVGEERPNKTEPDNQTGKHKTRRENKTDRIRKERAIT